VRYLGLLNVKNATTVLSVSIKSDSLAVINYFLYFRYEKNLVEAKNFGVKKAITTNVAMGFTQFVIFGTYALAFWYGTKLSVDEPDNYTIGRVITVSFSRLYLFLNEDTAGDISQ